MYRLLYLIIFYFFSIHATGQEKISGFKSTDQAHQLQLEKEFDKLISVTDQQRWMEFCLPGLTTLVLSRGN